MAIAHSTSKAVSGRNLAPKPSRAHASPKASARRPNTRADALPNGVILAIEAHRKALEIALTLLASVDITLGQAEHGGGDILDAKDSADVLVLKARAIARPLDMVRLAIQRVYQVHSGLDFYNLGQAAASEK